MMYYSKLLRSSRLSSQMLWLTTSSKCKFCYWKFTFNLEPSPDWGKTLNVWNIPWPCQFPDTDDVRFEAVSVLSQLYEKQVIITFSFELLTYFQCLLCICQLKIKIIVLLPFDNVLLRILKLTPFIYFFPFIYLFSFFNPKSVTIP